MTFCVYEHWRLDINRPFYVGKGTKTRAHNKRRNNRHHSNIVAKIGLQNITIKFVAENLSENEAFDLEKERIALWRGLKIGLTNKTDGGEGLSGMKHTPETRAKMVASATGRRHTEQSRAKLSEANKRRIIGPDHWARMVEANRGRPKSPEHRAKLSEAARLREARKRKDHTKTSSKGAGK